MNISTLKGVRELWASCETNPSSNKFCLKDSKGRFIIGWISKERAENYQIHYPNSTVELMSK